MRATALLLLLAVGASGEMIDRIAVTVGDYVITLGMIRDQIRIRAFVDGDEPVFNTQTLHQAAERLVDRRLLEIEMDDTRYPEPAMSRVRETLEQRVKARFGSEEAWLAALERRHIDPDTVLRFLQEIIRSLEFINLRFRRSAAITSEEIAAYYDQTFRPRWQREHPDQPVPPLTQVSEDIENEILESKTDVATEEWLASARKLTPIRYREEVFQ